MRIEHLAYMMPDPIAAAAWYSKHLGLRIVRQQKESPFGHFLADSRDAGQHVLVEIYNNPAAQVPFEVGDDGVGLPQERPVSTGLEIVETLVRDDLRGKITFKSGERGTQVVIRLRQSIAEIEP